MDMALSEIVDALLVDEDYIHFSQERYTDVNDDKLDNFFTHVVSFVGFFTSVPLYFLSTTYICDYWNILC